MRKGLRQNPKTSSTQLFHGEEEASEGDGEEQPERGKAKEVQQGGSAQHRRMQLRSQGRKRLKRFYWIQPHEGHW